MFFSFTKKAAVAKGVAALLLAVGAAASVQAQTDNLHRQSSIYEAPTDPLVLKKLDKWQDQKFGMIIHWGLYAVPGMIESWALCSEDWIERDSTVAYEDFKKWYWGLNKEFNPVNFNPEQWASAAKAAGMRYLVFTTKHHDGFNMFDTKQTDFKITNGPFAAHPRANVAKHVFEAFRQEGFMIGAYFSKPDWHSEYFWWPKYATPDRNVNYDIRKHPWRWNQYKQFTYNQLSELMHDYGSMDILWLDGGWVRPLETVNDEVRAWGAAIPEFSQEVDMPRIATMARQAQPGLLIVDRTVHGPYENYQTPEQRVPDHKIDNPWESCMTLGNNWGYVPNDQFKSPTKVIHSLVEIVAKGGSLLLGVGPKPDGTLPEEVVERLADIGEWLEANGEAIYSTRATAHYQDGSTFFTQGKNKLRYAIACLPEGEAVPTTLEWSGNMPKRGSKMKLLHNGKTVKWVKEGEKVRVYLPKSLSKEKGAYPALAFAFTAE
ncbi:alpha-L-fucosidase [Pontibacter ummariensis]|uniref:alpha-L-fucosidase n=1 Tax=Pontibacter ummariensis TaxID=1610492 RepID=A0A239G0S6_9BACT|nr:alpha-L-fucosidase [Pontibacter ummariensis]PRY11682.1 alpha-L-fucosidase [Pontibacter ummariensis]SNS63006.1 alpha-L-fucosidase [Pontibacter ummariensis]